MSLVCWGNLDAQSLQDSLLRAEELTRTREKGGAWGFRKGRQEVREFKTMPYFTYSTRPFMPISPNLIHPSKPRRNATSSMKPSLTSK